MERFGSYTTHDHKAHKREDCASFLKGKSLQSMNFTCWNDVFDSTENVHMQVSIPCRKFEDVDRRMSIKAIQVDSPSYLGENSVDLSEARIEA